ncbi:unnamed protein product [Trifolium pratense]|uniref:Uncharacterized protein n=1 Tax=Trifolium pratense TaxID=57577 RepID=A0ACB0IQ21_TRIPR|nr:unnamed protein product [Trifolium pratense]
MLVFHFPSISPDCGEPQKTATWKNGTDCCWWHGVISYVTPSLVTWLASTLAVKALQFGRFPSLTHLDLSECNFEGEVPLQISHLSKLKSLHLSWNYKLVWKETTLKKLVLQDTNMSSIRPNSMELMIFNQSSSLVTLNLENTKLSGKLKKSLICLPNIQELDMSGNDNLEGQLPELSCSTSLIILDLE